LPVKINTLQAALSKSTKVDVLLRKTGFKVVIVFSIIMALVIVVTAPSNRLIAWTFPIF
jgi:hypothetical protein